MTREGGQRRYHLLYAVSHAQSRRGLSTRITLHMCHSMQSPGPSPSPSPVAGSQTGVSTCCTYVYMQHAHGHGAHWPQAASVHVCTHVLHCTVLHCTCLPCGTPPSPPCGMPASCPLRACLSSASASVICFRASSGMSKTPAEQRRTACFLSFLQRHHITEHTYIARPTMHTYTAEDFDIEMDELDSDAASSSRAAMATDTVKRRRRTTKKEQAILEALFEEVGPSSTVYTDIALLMCMHHPYCSRAPRQPRHASASAPRLT